MLCAAALVLWVYHHDSHEKEPIWAVLFAVAFGFGMMWLIGMADDFALRTFRIGHNRVIPKAAIIAVIEEGGKLISILLLAVWLLRKHFNDPMDGLIYGRMVGLGMAVEESLLYLSLSDPTLQTFGIEIVRLFGHSLMGGLVGFAVGIGARPAGKSEYHPKLVVMCLLLSTTMHFAWNVAAYGHFKGLAGRMLPMVLMLTMMFLWKWFCWIAESRSRLIFARQPA
jgi:RsiW-degrading membrane proteinase PrsW (M82 family)